MDVDKYRSFSKKIGESQMIGNRGEMFVAFLLSQFCLVRQVASGTDVGVDLYCETLIEGVPHCHFWVQVKTCRKKLAKRMRFDAKDLEYWLRQPIPVFVFFVSDSNMGFDDYKINVVNLTEKFINKPVINPTSNADKTLESDVTITSTTELKRFVFQQVPETIARQFLRDGILFPIKTTAQNQYVKTYNSIGIERFARPIMKNIGRTAALLLKNVLSLPRDEFKKQREQLEQILESFAEWGNHDFHFALGLSKMNSLKYEEAIRCFERSRKNIIDDSLAPSDVKNRGLRNVEQYIALCKTKIKH